MTLPLILPSASKALAILDRLQAEVDDAKTFDEIDGIVDRAKAIQAAMKKTKDIADRAGAIRTKAECRLGAKLAELPKNTGAKGIGKSAVVDGDRTPTLKEMGISKDRSSQAQKLAAIPPARIEEHIETLSSEGKTVSPEAVLRMEQRDKPKPAKPPKPPKENRPKISDPDPYEEKLMEGLRMIAEGLSDIAGIIRDYEREDMFRHLHELVDQWAERAKKRNRGEAA